MARPDGISTNAPMASLMAAPAASPMKIQRPPDFQPEVRVRRAEEDAEEDARDDRARGELDDRFVPFRRNAHAGSVACAATHVNAVVNTYLPHSNLSAGRSATPIGGHFVAGQVHSDGFDTFFSLAGQVICSTLLSPPGMAGQRSSSVIV